MNPGSHPPIFSGACAPGAATGLVLPDPRAVGAPATGIGRRGFERIRKPAAVLCLGAWLLAALRLPAAHGNALQWEALLGHLLVAAAAFGRVWSTLHIGGHKNGRLCRSGPYARTRNPLYFFSWVGVTGIALLFRQPWLVPLAWAGFALSFAPLIRIEEARLAGLFGADYERYRREVPRFFPRIGGCAPVGDGGDQTPGKLRQIEYALADALWFLVAAAAVETLVGGGGWEALRAFLR